MILPICLSPLSSIKPPHLYFSVMSPGMPPGQNLAIVSWLVSRLFHVFWGFDRPKPPEQTARKYAKYDHSPAQNAIQFLYNGRNDLAQVVVYTFLYQVNGRSETRFQLNNPTSVVSFSDFVVR